MNKEILNKEINEMYLMNGDKPIMQINNIQDGDLRYEYNTKYTSRLDKYDGSFCIDVSELADYQKYIKLLVLINLRFLINMILKFQNLFHVNGIKRRELIKRC